MSMDRARNLEEARKLVAEWPVTDDPRKAIAEFCLYWVRDMKAVEAAQVKDYEAFEALYDRDDERDFYQQAADYSGNEKMCSFLDRHGIDWQ